MLTMLIPYFSAIPDGVTTSMKAHTDFIGTKLPHVRRTCGPPSRPHSRLYPRPKGRGLKPISDIRYPINANNATFDQIHEKWTLILSKCVTQKGAVSTVDYKALKSKPELLKNYLNELTDVSVDQFAAWPRDEQLAFLINAYNAWTI